MKPTYDELLSLLKSPLLHISLSPDIRWHQFLIERERLLKRLEGDTNG